MRHQLVFTREEYAILTRPVVGAGGMQDLLRQIQDGLFPGAGKLVDLETLERVHRYATRYGRGGFEDRFEVVLRAARRDGWRPAHEPTGIPPRTLGEEQAFIDGKARGRQEALLAVGRAIREVMAPDSLEILAQSLLEGLRLNPATTPGSSRRRPEVDPTEPAGRSEDATCVGDWHVWKGDRLGLPRLHGDVCQCRKRLWLIDGPKAGDVMAPTGTPIPVRGRPWPPAVEAAQTSWDAKEAAHCSCGHPWGLHAVPSNLGEVTCAVEGCRCTRVEPGPSDVIKADPRD